MVRSEAGTACYLRFTPKNKLVESDLECILSFLICDHSFPCSSKVFSSLDTQLGNSVVLEVWLLYKMYRFLALILKNITIFLYYLFSNIWVGVKNSLGFGSQICLDFVDLLFSIISAYSVVKI